MMQGGICLSAEEVRKLEKQGNIWVENYSNNKLIRGMTVPVREPWYILQPPPGAYAGGEYRYIRESEARAEPVLFPYMPAATMPASAIRRYVRIEQVGPDGCLCIMDRERSKTPQERERERVRMARIRKHGDGNPEEWKRKLGNEEMNRP